MNRLKDQVILVTGGSGTLGTEIVRHTVSEGAIVVNVDINVNDDLAHESLNCDITDRESFRNAVNKTLKNYGRIDGFVNNAYPRTNDWGVKFESIALESWQKNVDMQLNSIFSCCQIVLAIMQAQGFGSVINMSSIYGVVGPDFSVYESTEMTMPAAYSAIKGGVVNFTRYLAAYYGKHGVRVNSISPGGIFNNQSEAFVRQYEQRVPLGRMGLSKDIAPSVTFLLSKESSYITGHNLMVDGGWTCI